MAAVKPDRPHFPPATAFVSPWARRASLAVFGLIVTIGPLAFGAVDRLTQIGLASLLALGVMLRPPAVERPGRWINILLIALIFVLVVKEFGPASWFGSTTWRTLLTESYGLRLPWTHHPEPARALDALLGMTLALIWFAWVRTLSSERENRPVLAWTLFLAGAVLAMVSFATQGIDSEAIYGMRYSPGWRGFGPFPNRNHTACFLAMSAVIGAGCATWAGTRRRYPAAAFAVAMLGVILAALITTKSRGGLIAVSSGALLYAALVLVKVRSRRALAITLMSLVVVSAATVAFGSEVIDRFTSVQGGQVSNMTRVNVWRDSLSMWRDAPFFGHGAA